MKKLWSRIIWNDVLLAVAVVIGAICLEIWAHNG